MSTLVEDFRLSAADRGSSCSRASSRWSTGTSCTRWPDAARMPTSARSGPGRGDGGDALRRTLGDRVASMLYGGVGAADAGGRALHRRAASRSPLPRGTATTEAGGSVTVRDRVQPRRRCIDYKLRDVPELGYFTPTSPYPARRTVREDPPRDPGVLQEPRGHRRICSTSDGYICTGDIMEERGPDHLVYLDRRNDVLKLAQGEFVTLGAVGQHVRDAQRRHPADLRVRQLGARVPARRRRARPRRGRAPARAGRAGDGGARPRSAPSSRRRAGSEPAIVRGAAATSWSNASRSARRTGCCRASPSGCARGCCAEATAAALEQLYDDLERKQNDDLVALRDPASELTVLQKVRKALAASLAVDEVGIE